MDTAEVNEVDPTRWDDVKNDRVRKEYYSDAAAEERIVYESKSPELGPIISGDNDDNADTVGDRGPRRSRRLREKRMGRGTTDTQQNLIDDDGYVRDIDAYISHLSNESDNGIIVNMETDVDDPEVILQAFASDDDESMREDSEDNNSKNEEEWNPDEDVMNYEEEEYEEEEEEYEEEYEEEEQKTDSDGDE